MIALTGRATCQRTPPRSAGPSAESNAPTPGDVGPSVTETVKIAVTKIRVTNPNDNPNGTGQVQKDTTTISGTVGRVERTHPRGRGAFGYRDRKNRRNEN
ncbi:hypothetical protein DPMN_152448 [Dreissena polymorpha]|uniref:Uncharacterized protein n=1 Tax=Dreissena polymorpha TaxID=45954 RepID=A0A9D4J563_DREPO|nr:hypothetical protein DPMN_152448 [Dreissena polymorpha]